MRIESIEARNLFSFDRLKIHEIPAGMLVIVGPNGAGKTNVVRLLELIHAAIERTATHSQDAHRALRRFARGRRIESISRDATSVRLGIALTEAWERDLLLHFIRAALVSSIAQGAPTNRDRSGLAAWVREHVRGDDLAPLTEGSIVADLVDEASGQWETGYEFDVDGDRLRWVLEGVPSTGAIVHVADVSRMDLATHSVRQKLEPIGDDLVPQTSLAFRDLLPGRGEARTLSLHPVQPVTDPFRLFAAAADVAIDSGQRTSYSLAYVLRIVLERGLALLGDLREPPRQEYSFDEIGFDPSPTDGSKVPLRLFQLKNGDPAARVRYEAAQNLFARLTGSRFEISLAGSGAEAASGEQKGHLLISPVLERGRSDLPIEFAGAGLWEALLLSAALAETKGRVVVLDEPARNLHPTLQRRLLREMRESRGQFVVTTHSPYLISVEEESDLRNLVRFELANGTTRASRLPVERGADSARLRKALGESADARALLFTHGVILVEGGTELGALPTWFAKSATAQRVGAPDVLNVEVFSVDGDLNFWTFVSFLHGLGVPWAIVCDGRALQFDTSRRQVFEQVLDAGVEAPDLRRVVDEATSGDSTSFSDLRELGTKHGIFTLAEGWHSSIEGFETYIGRIAPGQLEEAAKAMGRSKPRQGRHVAGTTLCPAEVDVLYENLLRHLGAI